MLYIYGPPLQHTVFLSNIVPVWLENIIVILLIIWLINLFNFMDGIDGISGTQCVIIGVGAGLALFFFSWAI